MCWLQTTSREMIMPLAQTDDEQKAQQMLSAFASACFWFSCCCLVSSWFIFWFSRSFFFRQWFAVSVRPNLVKSSLPILGSQERETRQNLDRERLMKTKLCLERRVDPLPTQLPTQLPSRSVVSVTKKFISRLLSIVRVNDLCLHISQRDTNNNNNLSLLPSLFFRLCLQEEHLLHVWQETDVDCQIQSIQCLDCHHFLDH